jgi:hypothetical protein
VQSRVLPPQVEASHAQSSTIIENQALERPASIPDEERRALLSDRDDSTALFSGPAAVEDAELNARHVLLDDRVNDGALQTSVEFLEGPGNDHAGSALAFVWFEHDRER